jgi:ribosomal protein S18 acetylase RimI-like enzyme
VDELARQRRAAVAAWRADVAVRPGGAWQDLGGLVVHTTGIPLRHWNGAHVTSAAGLARLPDAQAWFSSRAMPWGVLVPAELDLDPGTRLINEQPVMLRSLADLPAGSDLDVRWDDGEAAAAVQADGFGDPLDTTRDFVLPKLVNSACAVVVAYEAGRPLATATLMAVDGVAAVFGVATLPGARRRGLGRAVTLAVLHEGRRRGCDLAYLNPSPLGYGVYAALGFTDAPPWRVHGASGERA